MSEHPLSLASLESIKDGTGHDIFGASGAHMYLHCAGSLIANLLAPDDSGYDASYGTTGHYVSETWRKTGKRPDHLVGTNQFVTSGEWGHLIEIDEEMLMYAGMCVEATDLIPGTHYVEQHVDFSKITPIANQGGRLDFGAVSDDMIVIADDKFGKGVRVYAKENPQLMLYAYGTMLKFDPQGSRKRFLIRVLQPRIDNFDEWECSRDDLLMFAGECRVRMAAAWKLDAPRKAGSHCMFCRVKATCAARAKHDVEMMEGVFEDLDAEVTPEAMTVFKERLDGAQGEFILQSIEAGALTTAQMAVLFPFRKASEKFWKALAGELMVRAVAGDVPGLKVVQSRGTRRAWIDEDAAVFHLAMQGIDEAAMYERKFKSPKQAEMLLRATGLAPKELPAVIGDLVRQPPGKPTLVPISDARPALMDPSSVFESLDDEDEDSEI